MAYTSTYRRHRLCRKPEEMLEEEKYNVEEADGLHFVKVYFDYNDLSDYIKQHLRAEDAGKYRDCKFVPTSIVNEDDFTITVTCVAAK